MIKRYCDCCGAEIDCENMIDNAASPGRLAGRVPHADASRPAIVFEVMHGLGVGVNGGGDLCKHCLIDAINTLDDRPKVYAR